MKKLLTVILHFITISLFGTTYYVSTNGNDNNPGTFSLPFATWQKGFDVANAGDIVYIRGGIYYTSGINYDGTSIGVFVSDKHGDPNNWIEIRAYENEEPVLDCAGMYLNGSRRGINFNNCSYFSLYGLTVRNVREYGQYNGCPGAVAWFMGNSSNFNIEKCVVHGSGNGFNTGYFCDNLNFTNCDAYNNYDYTDGGGLANGFSLTMYISPDVYAQGTHVTLTGCRSWGNSDDGFDLFGANGYFTFVNCWAFNNGWGPGGNGNGDGFKSHPYGSRESGIQRTFRNCISFDNRGTGFSSPPHVVEVLYNCVAFRNGTNGFSYSNEGDNLACIFRNNISYANRFDGLSAYSNYINDHNSWNSGSPGISEGDFISLNSGGSDGRRNSDGSLPELNFLHLAQGSDLINAGLDIGLTYGGSAPDLGAFESDIQTYVPPPPTPTPPLYISAVIENSTPSVITMWYNLTLANIVPPTSAFTVMVNSAPRNVSSVTISGSYVNLALSSPVAYGNVVTVTYNAPSSNPLQTPSGGISPSISPQTVTNRVNPPPSPLFSGASVENIAPSVVVMNYSLALANNTPSTGSFSVVVGSAARTVSSVFVSGTQVKLTLSSPVVYGNTVTVAYTKPSSNPLQTPAGGQAASFGPQNVTNRVNAVTPPPSVVTPPVVTNTPPAITINYSKSTSSGFVGTLNASGSYDANKDNLTYTWKIPSNIPVSATNGPVIEFLAPVVDVKQSYEFTLVVSDGKSPQSKTIPVEIIPYEPELEIAEIAAVETDESLSSSQAYNIVDGNIGTTWAVNGREQWVLLELKSPFTIQHVKLAFQPGQKREFYFDIYGSNDKESWDPILSKTRSCAFSGNLQVFNFPESKAEMEYRYVKVVGQGNNLDSWNYIAELKIFGHKHRNPTEYEDQIVKIYPNPAKVMINIVIDEPTFAPDFLNIISLTGKVLYTQQISPEERQLRIPIDFKQGIYIVQMGVGDMTFFTQKLIVSN